MFRYIDSVKIHGIQYHTSWLSSSLLPLIFFLCIAPANLIYGDVNDESQLTIVTEVINGNSGTAIPGDWVIKIYPQNQSAIEFPGESEKTISIVAGEYSVEANAGPGGYTTELGEGCSGSIAAGGSAICTIINTKLNINTKLKRPFIHVTFRLVSDHYEDSLTKSEYKDIEKKIIDTVTLNAAFTFSFIEWSGEESGKYAEKKWVVELKTTDKTAGAKSIKSWNLNHYLIRSNEGVEETLDFSPAPILPPWSRHEFPSASQILDFVESHVKKQLPSMLNDIFMDELNKSSISTAVTIDLEHKRNRSIGETYENAKINLRFKLCEIEVLDSAKFNVPLDSGANGYFEFENSNSEPENNIKGYVTKIKWEGEPLDEKLPRTKNSTWAKELKQMIPGSEYRDITVAFHEKGDICEEPNKTPNGYFVGPSPLLWSTRQ